MKNNAQRVLHITGAMNCGGSETLIMNLFRKIDRSKLNFDFCVVPKQEFFYSAEIRRLGGRIFSYPFKKKRTVFLPLCFFTLIKNLLTKGPYKAAHSHYHFANAFVLFAVWLCGVKTRVSHVHSNVRCDTLRLKTVRAVSSFFIRLFATDLCACTTESGKNLYGDKAKFTVINNGIDAAEFTFSADTRQRVRRDMNIENNFVVALAARFFREKNHTFLLDVFERLLKIKPDAVLLLIGGGPLEEQLKAKAAKLNIQDKVKFLGFRSDVADILKAADAFVMPSLYEGLPLAGVEAQAAGLPCFFADTITKELDITGVFYLPLGAGADAWAKEIAAKTEGFERKNTCELIRKAGFDISFSAEIVQKIYLA